MNKFFPLLIISFSLFHCVPIYAQEKPDSAMFRIDSSYPNKGINRIWSLDYPTSAKPQFSLDGKSNSTIFLGNWPKAINFSTKLYSFPGEDKSDYTYLSNVFNFHTLSDPLTINLDFHTKPILGMKKVDIYFFGNAIFGNQYKINRQGIYDESVYKRDLLWEIGGGIEYEYRISKFMFYDYSQFYENNGFFNGKVKDFSQGMHKGGFLYKF